MCGLAGVVSFGPPLVATEAMLGALGTALAHRGPDDAQTYVAADDRCALAHRRLAIIDLSPGGRQPMADPTGRYRLIYNGEVFNYRELRARLVSDGVELTSGSDTEVLLHLLIREGPQALARVRGMFALALWDDERRTTFLARDRFGIKPLYFACTADRLVFASEVGALWHAGLVERRVSPAAVLAYLSWGSVPPPLTWVDRVQALQPGTWRRWACNGAMTCGRYADPRERYVSDVHREMDEGALRESVRESVRDSVRAHLVADVPVGIFLSGGVDSSAIVSAARSAGASDLRTYTVITEQREYSEERFARMVAERFETTHQTLTVDAPSLKRDLPHVLRHLDQPTADAINSYYVSRAVRAGGLKAVLSGTGGDEVFGGYPSFRRLPRAARLRAALGPAAAPAGRVAGLALPGWRGAKWRHMCTAGGGLEEIYRGQRGLFMPTEIDGLAGPALRDVFGSAREMLATAEGEALSRVGPERPVASVARLETRLYLGSQLLRDIDAMSMAHSLEVRVPFVDHELLDTVWPAVGRYPHLLAGKRLLHETLERPLPAAAVRRPKQGFLLPFAEWLRGDLRQEMHDGMQTLVTDGWVKPNVPDDTWRGWEGGQSHWSRPWALGILGCFLAHANAARVEPATA